MDPTVTSAYNQQVRSVNDDFAAKRASNAFSRTLSQRRGSRNIGDFQQNFRRQLPGLQGSYARRGLGNSGVYQNALQQYTGDYARDLGRMYEDNSTELYQFDMNDATMSAERDRVLADLELQKAQQIALTAQNINNLKPYLG